VTPNNAPKNWKEFDFKYLNISNNISKFISDMQAGYNQNKGNGAAWIHIVIDSNSTINNLSCAEYIEKRIEMFE